MAYLPSADNLGTSFIGDVPDSPSVIAFHDETGNPAATNKFATFVTRLYSPAGTDLGALTTTVNDNHQINVAWPSTSKFTVEGVYSLRFTFTAADGEVVHPEPFHLVVQPLSGWLSLEQARAQWADAPLDDVFLYQILESAKVQCVEYAPAIAAGAVIPANYLQAQVMQARALYQSVIANQNDNIGVEGFTVRVFPLDFTIRALLRPKKAIAGMF